MIRVSVSYPTTEGQRFDHGYYQTKHCALICELLRPHGMVRLEIDMSLKNAAENSSTAVAVAHMTFENREAFNAGMAAAGKVLAADVVNYTDIVPVVLITDIG
jgi:uncharacterized protein (TIGR02118 family)